MEQDPPKAHDVGMAALNDLKENFSLVKNIVMPVFPIMFVFMAIDIALEPMLTNEYGQPTMGYHLFSIVSVVVSAWVVVHYVMRWHMFTLLGNVDYKGTWASPDSKYKLFFFKTIILQFVVILAMMIPVLVMFLIPPLGLIIMIPCWVAGIYIVCRLSFILPATVLGHTPNIKEIWDFAKGMVGKTFWAPLMVTYKYILLFIVYLVISGLILSLVGIIDIEGGQMSMSALQMIASLVFFALPTLVGTILFGLVYVGVLSRYYQWGLENRTDAYGDFK